MLLKQLFDAFETTNLTIITVVTTNLTIITVVVIEQELYHVGYFDVCLLLEFSWRLYKWSGSW